MSRRDRTSAGVTSLTHKHLNKELEGNTFQAICNHCEKLSEGTYERRDYSIGTTGLSVNTVVGVCSTCNEVITIPHQSTQDIKETIDKAHCDL